MNLYVLILLAAALFSACGGRPAQNDLPRSSGNSAEHSGTIDDRIQSSPDATSAPYRVQLLDTLIADHNAVIDVAQMVRTRAEHEELKDFARMLIAEQQEEIAQMQDLRQRSFPGAPAAINAQLLGVEPGVSGLDPKKLDLLKARPFDLEFLKEMTLHYEGSIELCRDAREKLAASADGTDQSLSSFARTLEQGRRSELTQMRKWQTAW